MPLWGNQNGTRRNLSTHKKKEGITMSHVLDKLTFFTNKSPKTFASGHGITTDDPNKLERQINRLRGKFFGSSGSSQDILSEPSVSLSTIYSLVSLPFLLAIFVSSRGFSFSCGADGNQPIRSERMLQSIRE